MARRDEVWERKRQAFLARRSGGARGGVCERAARGASAWRMEGEDEVESSHFLGFGRDGPGCQHLGHVGCQLKGG